MQETILKMSDITKVFGGVIALEKVQFELYKGEVHALIGENGAGKSTLMKILLGMQKKDDGNILYHGKQIDFLNPAEALSHGISMIHQEVNLVHQMSVAENIWLGREEAFSNALGLISPGKRSAKTKELLQSLDIDIPADEIVDRLSIAQMQLVEIARAVSFKPNIIIMDEPTSALTDQEVDKLYKIIRDLSAKGVSVIFISHKLEELFEICDRITIMRDGHYIATYPMENVTEAELIKMISGREAKNLFSKTPVEQGEVALEIKNLSRAGTIENVNLTVRKGEIVGLCGLMGAGRSEILRAVFGIDKKDSGEILINGQTVVINSPEDAVRAGLGMVTEDRLRQGVVYTMSVMHNATLAIFNKLVNRFGYNNVNREKRVFAERANDLSVKYSSPNALIGELSGGNQQKIIVERWMLTNPKIMLLDEPTRGIDVGAKSEIYALIDRLAREGIAVLMVSSEMPEILSLCDRIMVIYEGRIVYETTREKANQEILMNYAFGLGNDKELKG